MTWDQNCIFIVNPMDFMKKKILYIYIDREIKRYIYI